MWEHTARLERPERQRRLKSVLATKLPNLHAARLERSKRRRRAPEEEEIHIMQDEIMSVQQTRGVGQKERLRPEFAAQMGDHLTVFGRVLLLVSLLMGAISHGYHLFLYPLYITDEGIYMQQAWSILREGTLSPYTYSYDHAPAGWLLIAGWVALLPHQFETFGDAINTVLFRILLVPLATLFLLFHTTRSLL